LIEKEPPSTYITPPLPETPNNHENINIHIILLSSLICVLIITPQNNFINAILESFLDLKTDILFLFLKKDSIYNDEIKPTNSLQ